LKVYTLYLYLSVLFLCFTVQNVGYKGAAEYKFCG